MKSEAWLNGNQANWGRKHVSDGDAAQGVHMQRFCDGMDNGK